MIDFANVRNIAIPEGEVFSIARGAEILWRKQKYKRELAYIESTGKQYIDTGFVATADSTIKTRVAFTTNPAGTSAEQINGVSNNGRCAWGYARSVTNKNFYLGIQAKNINTNIPLDALPHTFVFSMDGHWSIDEHTGFQDSGASLPPLSVWLFARHRAQGDLNTPCKEKLYFCKFFDGDTLVRDFIPVLDWNDVPCMYDKVTKELFYNQGTGEFLYG